MSFKIISNLFNSNKDVHKTARLIVLGHQKTGTTAIASLLSKISGETLSSDPLYVIDQGKAKAAEYILQYSMGINKLCKKYPELFDVAIIKDPDFIFLYNDIKRCFCNAKMLFIVRDPRDTIRSICNRLNLTGEDVDKFPSVMKEKNRHWELILSGKLPELGSDKSNFIKNLANRWCAAADVYLENKEDMILVKYEEFRKNKEGTIKNLAGHFGMSSDIPISEFVNVQYQPKGSADVIWDTFFGQDNLKIIEEVCEKYLKFFDY